MRRIVLGAMFVILLSFGWSTSVFASSPDEFEEPTPPTSWTPEPEPEPEEMKPTDTEPDDPYNAAEYTSIVDEDKDRDDEVERIRDSYDRELYDLIYSNQERYEVVLGSVSLMLGIVSIILFFSIKELVFAKIEFKKLTERLEEKNDN